MTVRINEAVAEALDAVGDDPVYDSARRLLLNAERLLRRGSSTEARRALDAALAELDATCPL
ncbi:hypothetical protein [Streptomyces sp. NPDC101166]|uniref:hypothetical protein n=1 Tax=Streptomyces sp. NPDC101166 TaxID=3366120 RepID=UPI00382DA786